MMNWPYWLSWLIYIGGLVACFSWGWLVGRWRDNAAMDAERSQYVANITTLRNESDRRRQELRDLVTDFRNHMDHCHQQTGARHD